jgi:cytoskeletal protein RodZ
VRIPLDLYQILGVPIQATPEQIGQAFADRCQQLPRQEYSKAAITARTHLLQDAYAILSDPEARTCYDQSILTESASTTPEAEGIELEESQLVGALLLLQEQSDYERIAQIGSTYLQRSIDLNQLPSSSAGSDEDVILAMALANLEAGRECWQQKQFEKAADVLQSGLKLLTQEQLFPTVQREIELDLYKLRPYQILELLAAPEARHVQRQQGFTLLQAMLDERGGIDGQQEDRSGLDMDDFLQFIQQLRCHLTVQEQQDLFEKEAERPSAVAQYLLVYTLVAKGCSQGQPEYIEQAKTVLTQLANRQNIHIEKAMCYLLLGQPGAAIQTLPLSRDKASLEFIHQYSEGAEDLVPGLFLYTERWLQQEVYPYFKDLTVEHVSLQTYFNDEHIQAYLSTLTPEPVSARMPATTTPADLPRLAKKGTETLAFAQEGRLPAQTAHRQMDQLPKTKPLWPVADQQTTELPPLPRSPSSKPQQPIHSEASGIADPSSVPLEVKPTAEFTPESVSLHSPQATQGRRPSRQSRSQLQFRRWFWVAAVIFLGLLGLAGMIALFSPKDESVPEDSPPPEPKESAVSLSPSPTVPASPTPSASLGTSPPTSPPTASPSPTPSPAIAKDTVSTEDARQLIQTWQKAKAAAMGKQRQISQLDQILAEPILSEWKTGAQADQANQVYWQYTFDNLQINAIQKKSPTQVAVDATVKETAKAFQQGQLAPNLSYTGDTYRVRYELVRQQDQWKIKGMVILN